MSSSRKGRVKMSDFHMVACVKAVPGSTEVKMDPKTNTIVRDGKADGH